jgi:hypothetical protein
MLDLRDLLSSKAQRLALDEHAAIHEGLFTDLFERIKRQRDQISRLVRTGNAIIEQQSRPTPSRPKLVRTTPSRPSTPSHHLSGSRPTGVGYVKIG